MQLLGPSSAPSRPSARPRARARAQAPIPLLDPAGLLAGNHALHAALRETACRLLASGQYVGGAEVVDFEREAAAALGRRHAVGVANGSDALLLALAAAGVQAHDQVLVPTYTFVATAGSVARLGAVPRFVDVCPACLTLQPAEAAARVTDATRAVVPVHLFGQLAALPPLIALAAGHQLAVVEDAAQSFGATAPDGADSPSDASPAAPQPPVHCQTTSFFPSKNLGGFGDAGLVACDDDALATQLRSLREHGSPARYVHTAISGNHRLDALQAALLRRKLPHVPRSLARRRRNAARYAAFFAAAGVGRQAPCTCLVADPGEARQVWRDWREAGGRGGRGGNGSGARTVFVPHVADRHPAAAHTFNQYVVQFVCSRRRDRVAQALRAQGIGHSIYYPVPLHLQPCFAGLGHRAGDFPVSEHAAATSLALPIAEHVTPAQQRRVVAAVLAEL